MEIRRDRMSECYMTDNRRLGNCFTVIDKENTCHYEFEIQGSQALVKYDSIRYIKEAIQEFRKYNKNVHSFYNESRSFFQGFEPVQTFKLPLSILQPSQYFLDEDKLKAIETYLENEEITVPVCIIDDEYVLLDGHTRCRYLIENDYKMVNVYMDDPDELTQEYVYIAKENNLFKVKQLEILPHEEYLIYLEHTFGNKNN